MVEIASPGDETWSKLDFYAARAVDEILIVDLTRRSLTWLILEAGQYVEAESSSLLEVSPEDLARRIEWPPSAE